MFYKIFGGLRMFKKVYRFTNENVASFNDLYKFDNAKVLSVLGSGDQYFTSLLNGASDIELYDINNLAWDYFVLKFYGIMILSYEEFINYFVANKLDDYEYFKKIKNYLPFSVSNKLENLYSKNGKLSWIFEYDPLACYGDYKIIPYFKEDEFYKLQSILRKRELPTFYLRDFSNLSTILCGKSYDIILASNIFYSLYLSNEIDKLHLFKDILNSYNYSEFQAIYCWWLNDDMREKLLENNFDIESVHTSRSLKFSDDYVISLRK